MNRDVLSPVILALKQSDLPPEDWPEVLGLVLALTGWEYLEKRNAQGQLEEARQTLSGLMAEIQMIWADWVPGADVETALRLRFGDLPKA